jgi:benzoyl-CoA reductase/2-hydroxyglutaryl-CoA dehydratase subunit BcrC/BadD/HgdB
MSPGACDANSKIHEFVSHQFGIPQFFVEKPTDSGRRGREQYEKYFRAFIEQLQDFLGEELDEERMRDVAEKANRCTELYYELWDLHKHKPCPVPNIFALYAYSTRFTLWGRTEGLVAFESYIHTVKEIMEKGDYPAEERARSYWTYLPYFFDFAGFYDWLEKQGIVYLGDCLTLSFPSMIDTTDKESMITGLAENAWNMPMTRQMGAEAMSMRWLDDLTHSINDLGADCAIYCGHHSCKQTWSVVNIVRKEIMNQTGVPTLILQGDSWIRRMTPISVLQDEISDFIRNVVERRSGKARRKTGTNGG